MILLNPLPSFNTIRNHTSFFEWIEKKCVLDNSMIISMHLMIPLLQQKLKIIGHENWIILKFDEVISSRGLHVYLLFLVDIMHNKNRGV